LGGARVATRQYLLLHIDRYSAAVLQVSAAPIIRPLWRRVVEPFWRVLVTIGSAPVMVVGIPTMMIPVLIILIRVALTMLTPFVFVIVIGENDGRVTRGCLPC
jgi:hypothetical protein